MIITFPTYTDKKVLCIMKLNRYFLKLKLLLYTRKLNRKENYYFSHQLKSTKTKGSMREEFVFLDPSLVQDHSILSVLFSCIKIN